MAEQTASTASWDGNAESPILRRGPVALLAHAPSTYKRPIANDCPAQFDMRLYEAPNPADSIQCSLVVGAPPLRAPAAPEALLDAIDAVKATGRA